MKKLRVGVIYGGRSGEHEVSIASAASIFRQLDRTRYEPVPIRIDKDGRWTLADKPPQSISAAEVIEQTRVESARPIRPGREAHLVPYPGDDTLMTIERRDGRDVLSAGSAATVTGLGVDVIFPVLHGPYGEDGTVQVTAAGGSIESLDANFVASEQGDSGSVDAGVAANITGATQISFRSTADVPTTIWLITIVPAASPATPAP